jgi:hypothetical protein
MYIRMSSSRCQPLKPAMSTASNPHNCPSSVTERDPLMCGKRSRRSLCQCRRMLFPCAEARRDGAAISAIARRGHAGSTDPAPLSLERPRLREASRTTLATSVDMSFAA